MKKVFIFMFLLVLVLFQVKANQNNYIEAFSYAHHMGIKVNEKPTATFIKVIQHLYDLKNEQAAVVAGFFYKANKLGWKIEHAKDINEELRQSLYNTLLEGNKYLSENSNYHFDYKEVTDLNFKMLTTKNLNERIKLEAASYSKIFGVSNSDCFIQSVLLDQIVRYNNHKKNILDLAGWKQESLSKLSYKLFMQGKASKCEN